MTTALASEVTVKSYFPRLRLDPSGRAFRTLTLLCNLVPYISFYRKLHTSGYGQIVPKRQSFYNRKFVTPYLATFLTSAERLIIQGNLCDFLDRRFTPQSLTGELSRGIVLWQSTEGEETQSVTLRVAARTVLEGDLLLEHHLGDQSLHKLSFAIVPGRILSLTDPQVVFIGGSQGLHGSAEAIRQAAKANGEITPANMTLIAMRGLCHALGIKMICGVRARYQPVVHETPEPHLSVYDSLWLKNEGIAQPKFCVMPSYPTEAEVKGVEGKNRSRTRRKRRFRQSLIAQIADGFRRHLNPDIDAGPQLPMARSFI